MFVMDARNDQLPDASVQAHGLREQLAVNTQRILLKELAAGLAHELNQPLAAIAAYAEGAASLLRRNPERGADAIEIVESIAREALRAGDTIQRVRNTVELPPFRRGPLDCVALVGALTPIFEALATQQGVVVRLDQNAPLPSVSGDPVWLQTLVLLLFRNALDAVAKLPSDLQQVTISVHCDNGDVEIMISDNETGVAKSLARSLYTAFSSTKQRGMGLNLAACEDIALQHGGVLRLSNSPLGGVLFVVRLPAVTDRNR